MKLDFLPLDRLHRSRANMRFAKRAPDVTDILPSIRARGVLMPIIVRPEPDPTGADGFGVVAGDRRFAAACIVADEQRAAGGDPDPEAHRLPCAIIEAGDDAAALEASMLENFARLDPDEVTRWESFTALIRQGRAIADIATTFGLPELAVKRTLALGNLLPRIRSLYRAGEIDATTVRHLTLATKSQQKAWLALDDDDDTHAPTGQRLKAWLFGGTSIPVSHALFDVDAAKLAIVADLFGEGGYFAEPQAFWTAQDDAIAARRAAYLAAGWADAVIVPTTAHFSTWEMQKTPKRKGGRVYIDVRASGEVCFHEGYLTLRECARQARGDIDSIEKPVRPEISTTMRTYLDLHRHAAVRTELAGRPQVALRLMAAHAIAGSHLWRVDADPRRAHSDSVAESVEGANAEAAFDGYRRAAQALLGYPDDELHLVGRHGRDTGVTALFARLLALPDAAVMEIVAIVMGETLASGSAAVDAVGLILGTDMARWWRADDTFFALLRDRELLGAMVAEVAGDTVARANAGEKTKTLKGIIRAHLDGEDGRTKVDRWVPRWMRFAPGTYTDRGGATRDDSERIGMGAEDVGDAPDDPDAAAALPIAA